MLQCKYMERTIRLGVWQVSSEGVAAAVAIFFVSGLMVWQLLVGFSWAVYLVCLGVAGLLVVITPVAGLYTVIICTILFERWFTLQPLQIGQQLVKLYPLDIILGCMVVGVVGQWLVGKRHTWRDDLFGWTLWLFVAVVSVQFIRALFDPTADIILAFSTFKNYALYAVVYWLTLTVVQTPAQYRRFIQSFFIAGVGLLFFVGYGLATGHGLWAEYVPLSTPGMRLLGGPHSFYLAMVILMLSHRLVSQKRSWSELTPSIILLLLWVVGLLASLQRHLWLAITAAAGVLIWQYRSNQRQAVRQLIGAALFICAIIITGIFWVSSWQLNNLLLDADIVRSLQFRLVALVGSGGDSSTVWRIASWFAAWQAWQGHWLFGTGLGKLLHVVIGDQEFNVEMRELHNGFIGMTLQLGLVGFGAAVIMLGQWLKQLWRQLTRSSIAGRHQILLFVGPTVLFLVAANFGTYFDINLLVIFWWLTTAGTALAMRFTSKPSL